MKTVYLYTFIAFLFLESHGQSIEKFSIDSGGTSTSVNDIEVLYTIGEVVVREITTATVLVSEGFINPSFNTSLSTEDNQLSQFNISVYPNPTKQYINISTSVVLTKIELYDALGRYIFQSKLVDNSIDVSTYEAGVYFLKLYKNNQFIIKRIVIE